LESRLLLKEGARLLGVPLTEAQADAFLHLSQLLQAWNQKINLTSITEENQIIVKHFLDSLSILTFITAPDARLIDVGTGGGFPGIPLKLCRPTLHLTLLDATAKKVNYLETVCAALGVDAVCINARAETLGQDKTHREQYDCATIRAVADMAPLAEYTLPLLKIGGCVLAQKGRDAAAEAAAAARAIALLGGEVEAVQSVAIPYSDFTRNVVIIRKVRHTPPGYPRSPGTPQKKPLQ